jgi:hypothetical protein
MPTNRSSMDREALPGTLRRSSAKAQRTYAETLKAAHDTYPGDEERAHRTAIAALKHSFEKVGDHWEPKDEKARRTTGGEAVAAWQSAAASSARHRAMSSRPRKALRVAGRSKMTKLRSPAITAPRTERAATRRGTADRRRLDTSMSHR